jgi:hypothetical protein
MPDEPKKINFRSDVKKGEFKRALVMFANNAAYRERAQKDPGLILKDFALTKPELDALGTAAILSGADVHEIDKARLNAMQADVGVHPDITGGRWSISCCSCCCCCCGETAVVAA